MNNRKLLMMVEVAIFAAIGIILDKLTFSLWPQGGSISLVMVPIIIIAFRWGTIAGLVTGLLIGTMNAMFGGFILTPLQGFIDYFFAFTVVGLAGLMRPLVMNTKSKAEIGLYITIGTIVGGLLRYVAHATAGYVFFSEYAGDQNVLIYTIVYNGSYMVPAIILTAAIVSLLFAKAPKLLKPYQR
ncbi:energy-coupled thiamine transporter ThiT [Kurthia senegalensis]|uniref:energy-coupled thiamine transporter ThiT n=1 Tax=Kurthia senegalensis TaxID=1033740 RepID=UPI00028978E6|nr:energy-coupled thiamine transporter ThiT [Kurthia senegalensis]